MTKLIDLKRPKPRFARSINVERDSGSEAIDGYLPVGRAIESIDRLARAMLNDAAEVAISITGPYGSGKSSLALVVDSLLAPIGDTARASAEAMLEAAAPRTLEAVHGALAKAQASESGFIRAVVTAQREPIGHTVVRALLHGAERFTPAPEHQGALARAVETLREIDRTLRRSGGRLDARTIRGLVSDLSKAGPILLLIDEFGKNLEAFAETPGDGDLFLLQELAEWTRAGSGTRLALVTLQHMAFGDYADGASALQRREWVKIQGRFEDIPFVDTPAQTQALVAAAFDAASSKIAPRLEAWASQQVKPLKRLGLNDLASGPALLSACWPLHPLALAVLPELCQRYGQNERTMFSFLAGNEPLSVVSFLRDAELPNDSRVPAVHLDRLYDYFLESASGMVSISADASRWLEIDTRVRDAHGLSEAARRVLKTVGLLNLVSAGGALRASRAMVRYAATDGQPGSETTAQVDQLLTNLESSGLITYREFADEFRVWQGSDFDLKSAITLARRRLRDEAPRLLLQRVMPLGPLVAARHSHASGTLRAFERSWADHTMQSVDPLSAADRGDGVVLYVLDGPAPTKLTNLKPQDKPIVFVTTADPSRILEAARELAALDEVLATDEGVRSDWVIRRELAERRAAAAAALQAQFEAAFGATAKAAKWHWAPPASLAGKGGVWRSKSRQSPSSVLSDVADAYFASAVLVRNDLINRHELSSQAAKARREVVEVMSSNGASADLGIEGFGPDKTLYLSVLKALDLHGAGPDGFGYRTPRAASPLRPVWAAIVGRIRTSNRQRLNVHDLYEELSLPPYGLRAGVAPVVLAAALLVHKDEFALYEHGTFRPSLTADVAERLLRNPTNFEVKCFATASGDRNLYLAHLAGALSPGRLASSPTLVGVVSSLVARVNMLPAYARKTKAVSPQAIAIRDELLLATEPDVLIFERLPEALGYPAIVAGASGSRDLDKLAGMVASAMDELANSYPKLLDEVRTAVSKMLRADSTDYREALRVRAAEISDKVIDPRVKSLIAALCAAIPEEDAWLEYVGMQLAGSAPKLWSDEDLRRFAAAIQDAGSSFRRVEALHADMRSREGLFEAVRFHANWSHGPETVKLVTWDDSSRGHTQDVMNGALDALAAAAGSRETAIDWMMASLAEEELRLASKEPSGQITIKKVDTA